MKTGLLILAGAIICLGAAGLGLALGKAKDGSHQAAAVPATTSGTDVGRPILPASSGGLRLPLDCVPGQTCVIQNYVDVDPGPGVRDHRCGSRTYEGHNGTDFRLPDEAARLRGLAVLAAMDGVVQRVRDGVPDISVIERGLAAVEGQECGNGVIIAHGDGLTTQYCHMASGSVSVASGQTVRAGDPIGRVGMSGQTEYPHLHFTVRDHDRVVDPFAPSEAQPVCSASPGRTLWAAETAQALAYHERSVLNAGFAGAPPSMASIEGGGLPLPTGDSAVLVAYVRAIGLKAGDVERLTVIDPKGEVVATTRSDPLASNRAQQMVFAGRRARAGGWAAGVYTATYVVEAEGQTVLERRFSLTL